MKLESIVLVASVAAQCNRYDDNVEWRSMSTSQQDAYLNALKCLKSKPSKLNQGGATNLWEDLVYIHKKGGEEKGQSILNIHDSPIFLAWHRAFLAIHDDFLKRECGYGGPFPYWDWAADSQRVGLANVWRKLGVFKSTDGSDCVQVAPQILSPLTSSVPDQHDVKRCFNNEVVSDYSTVNKLLVESKDFADFNNRVGIPHAQVHIALGGDMKALSRSPNDPIFFFHHRMIDYLWDQWQRSNSNNLRSYSSSYSDVLNFYGLRQSSTVGDLLNNQGGGLGGLMCKKYQRSIVANVGKCQSRQFSLADSLTPSSSDKSHKYNIRVPEPIPDDFLYSMGMNADGIANVRKVEAENKQFIEFINKRPIRYPSSLGKLKAGLMNGWRQQTQEEYDQTKKMYESLLNEFKNGNHDSL